MGRSATLEQVELTEEAVERLQHVCKLLNIKPSVALERALETLERRALDKRYLGQGSLAEARTERATAKPTKKRIKDAIAEKHGYSV